MMMEHVVRGLIGVVVLLGVCVLLSNHRRGINWHLVGGGIVLQILLAVFILATPFGGFVNGCRADL